MSQRLKAIILDDDKFAHDILCDMCCNSDAVEIVRSFYSPKEFIREAPGIDFDIALLDILMPGMDGLNVARLLNGKPFLFITSADEKLKEALELEPIDVISKPYKKERLENSLQKAFKLIIGEKVEYGLFNTAESNHKVKIKLTDIIHVATDEVDPRNKIIQMPGGEKLTIMDCTLDYLLERAPKLVQVNRGELISIDAIGEVDHDIIVIKDIVEKGRPKEITLSKSFKDGLSKRIFFL